MLKFLCIFLFAVGVTHSIFDLDYCNPKTCPHQGQHIRCNNNGSFSKYCVGNYTLRNMSPSYIHLILQEHNTYRNLLAGGGMNCFYPAARMAILKWDNDLAENAAYNVRTCRFEHDKCRSTAKFPYAGQNIYTVTTKKLYVDITFFIEEAIFLWFTEYLYANHSLMASVVVTKPQTGHFTLMMNDRLTHIGCALLESFLSRKIVRRFILFTCNYSSNNLSKLPSYWAGESASLCIERDQFYNNLCTHKGINSNDFYWFKKIL